MSEEKTLREIQNDQSYWLAKNFPEFGSQKAYQALLGVMEEVGELSHAHLKGEQGIRGTSEELDEQAKDAVGDITLFLSAYCIARGWDYQQIIEEVWGRVSKRDFIVDPINGGER